MLEHPIDQINRQVLESLVAGAVSERRDLEFKRDLPTQAPDDLKEFLADITSLANAQGGDLIFGVEDTDGVATAIPGVAIASADGEILRLENIVRDGIEPRLSGVHMRWIPITEGCGAIVIRVPASLAAPHRIRYRNSGRFYNRNSRGKYEMDVHELRTAFTQSEQLPQKIRQLHADAVEAAQGRDMPFTLNGDPAAVVSTIPLGFFREHRDLDINPGTALAPVEVSGGMNAMLTLEGVLMHTPLGADNAVRSYALTHRGGRTDVAWTIGGVRDMQGEERRLVWARRFERGLLDAAGSTIPRLRPFGVEGPWVILVTLIGVRGFQMIVGDGYGSPPAWRDTATFRELIVELVDPDTMLPLFKLFWRVFGLERPAGRPV